MNTTGNENTATGSAALYNNTTGGQNTADGRQALNSNQGGLANTAVGYQAAYFNLLGSYNTAIGLQALYNNTINGNGNTAIGYQALYNTTGGSGNIALGYQAGYNLTTGDNNIDIGNAGVAGEGNTIRMGVQGTQTATFIAGIYGTTVSGSSVTVNSNGRLGVAPSSRRFKQNIQSMDDASSVLLSLHPVTFNYKPDIDPQGTPQFGLIAEEVDRLDPDLVVRDGKNQIFTVRYEAVNAMLLNEFLKQHRRVEEQNTEIQALKEKVGKVESLEKRLNELQQLVQALAKK